ncbi:MAG: DNA mismatch repair endonuclease MutL [Anaerolineales bacterium]|nr:DNA mismatch repair endonuclease MutL [Anaerolineales bacterium]
MTIRKLPDEVASAIAAGEVIERPASVVKELIENALDAGATEISIAVEDAGKRLIAISDNGAGIPSSELPLAVARYATSKLETAADLFAIDTLGFRGEALASIGAVSRMELISHTRQEDAGARIIVEGGKAVPPKRIAVPQGTVVRVRDLFFNVPARRAFLKSDITERRRINLLVTQYAIAYPAVRFVLEQDGRVSFRSSGNGSRREVLAAIYGTDPARRLLHVQSSPIPGFEIDGYISPPELHRGTRRDITLFVNGRSIQDSSLTTAVVQAYHTLLMVGRYPMAVLTLTIPPETVDVNVHPTKAEVRFKDPRQIFSFLQRSVRATLLGQVQAPGYELSPTWVAPAEGGLQAEAHLWAELDPHENAQIHTESGNLQPALTGGVPLLRPVGQVGTAYLVAEGPDGLYLIDQHAAHERILFEKMLQIEQDEGAASQTLLSPPVIELSPAEGQFILEQLDTLMRLGFELEAFGERTYRMRAVPVILAGRDPEDALRAVLDDFDRELLPLESTREEQLVSRICKRFAIKAGQVLSLQEQEGLLRDLEACQSPRTCPHGRPTMIHLSVDSLERQFGRRG